MRLRPERGAKSPRESERGWGPASIEKDTPSGKDVDARNHVRRARQDRCRGARPVDPAWAVGNRPGQGLYRARVVRD